MTKNIKLWPSHRRHIERAIESALNPAGMSIHNGKAYIDANILRRMLQIIDDKPDSEHTQGTTDIALLKQEVLDAYASWTSAREMAKALVQANVRDATHWANELSNAVLAHEKTMSELVSKALKK